MPKKVLIIATLALISILGAYLFLIPRLNSAKENIIEISGKKLIVEIADTAQKQNLGLSYRKSMAEDKGMIFIFPQESLVGFWMKDMNFSLDMIWIDSSGKIVGITKNISPDTYPQTFAPPSPVKYVIEVNAGWSDKNNIKIGNYLKI